MDPGNRTPHLRNNALVSKVDHERHILGFDQMLMTGVAVAEVKAELDVHGHRIADPRNRCDQFFHRNFFGDLRVFQDGAYLNTDVPLNGKIAMRYSGGDLSNLLAEARLISRPPR